MRAFDASYMAGGMDAYALRDNASALSSPATSPDYEDIEEENQGAEGKRAKIEPLRSLDPLYHPKPKNKTTLNSVKRVK
ncbi:hypothetical protein TNCT_364521 [Trichonephila clavata]|uniref:Uncharacterized protein n=1 Tax=Trichonephila clavata TaxID=2740835 RepID=A0A8X6K531_TRICU|nr:hypothetical protein TNCT_364521 [Trichonephila clavata]